jgi:chorismate synthase
MKYGGFQDAAGGGHFSGRLTAPLCIAGGLCKQWLENEGVRIGAHIVQIGLMEGEYFSLRNPDLDSIRTDFPTLTPEAAETMRETIAKAKAQGDSVGGIIECAAVGLPTGLGEPMFGGMESRIAQIVYGIPAVKTLEFGLGESFSVIPGSESNDAFTIENGEIKTTTNNCGGILGGITTGMPLVFSAAIKPTPSIAKPQQTVNLETGEITTLQIKGRHDPCIVPRAVPVVEAAAAIAIFDAWLEYKARS